MELGICIVVFLILWAAEMPWWLAAIVVFVGWTLVKGKVNPFAGIGVAVGGAVGALTRLAITLVVLAITLLAFNRVLGIDSFAVMDELGRLGPFFWNWPAGIQLPLIMYVFGATLLWGLALTTAYGRWKPAGIFFGSGFLLVVMMYFFPTTLAAIVPTKTDPVTSVVSPSASGIDAGVAGVIGDVRKDGAVPMVAKKGSHFLFGHYVDDAMGAVKGWWNKPTPASSSAPAAPPAAPPAPAGPISECDTPCKMQVGWDTRIETADGSAGSVRFFRKTNWIEIGTKLGPTDFAVGEAEFVSADPSTPVRVQIFRAK